MKTNRFALCWLLLGASVALVSCRDSNPVAPQPFSNLAPSFSKGEDKGQILSCTELPYATASKVIGKEGGTINVGPHSLTIPAGALSKSVTIRATAPSERHNHVDLQPEGLKFSKPATLTMSTANCILPSNSVQLKIAYTDDKLRIYYFLPTTQEPKKVSSPLDHFSDYAVAW